MIHGGGLTPYPTPPIFATGHSGKETVFIDTESQIFSRTYLLVAVLSKFNTVSHYIVIVYQVV